MSPAKTGHPSRPTWRPRDTMIPSVWCQNNRDRRYTPLLYATFNFTGEHAIMTNTTNNESQSIKIVVNNNTEYEISIKEILESLSQGKFIILSFIAFFLVASFVYLAVTPNVYQSKAVIQIGRIGSACNKNANNSENYCYEPISKGVRLQNRIQNTYSKYIYSVTVDKKDNNIITITAQSWSPEKAQQNLHFVLQKIIREQNERYEYTVDLYRLELKKLKKQYSTISKQNEEGMGNFYLYDTMEKLSSQIFKLEDYLSPISTSPTIITLNATYNKHPIKPKKYIIITAAMLFGFFCGVIFVFIIRTRTMWQRDRLAT